MVFFLPEQELAAEQQHFEDFFQQFYVPQIEESIQQGKKSIEVDFSLLDKFNHEFADKLLDQPKQMMEAAMKAIASISHQNIPLIPRFTNLPAIQAIRIRNLRSEHIGKFMVIDGVVRRASEVKPEILEATFECPDCGAKIPVMQTERVVRAPALCDGCGRKEKFNLVDKKLFDARWVVMEEPYEIATAETPGEIKVYMKDDLTSPSMQNRCDPGNRITVVGILREIKKILKGKLGTQMDIFLDANHVKPSEIEWEEVVVNEADEKNIKEMAKDPRIYEKIIASIAPSIYGLDEIKEAIAYQMFGGVPRVVADGTRLRGDIHLLLVGDPALGKTVILKLVSKILPRGRYVSGKGVTGVGLTASVIKDEEFLGGWVLEAGAMVLCHKSLIAIDEFDKMNKDDQIAMHEAMSTQTISIAKASIVATLPAQTAVLAGANPKYSRFDPYRSIAEQIDIPDTLLSRFDLKFVLRDEPVKELDEKLATHVIQVRMSPQEIKPLIPPEMLRKYIAYVRHTCKPDLTAEAAEKIKQFYIDMRSSYAGQGEAMPITLRQHESLIRLAEAAAKIRLSNKVEALDADRALKVMEFSLKQTAFDLRTGKFDIDRTEGVASSKRNAIRIILDIIEKLEKTIGKPVPVDEILAEAENAGISSRDTEELLTSLKRDGTLYEPKVGHLQKAM